MITVFATIWKVHHWVFLSLMCIGVSAGPRLLDQISTGNDLVSRQRGVRILQPRIMVLVHRSYFLTEVSGFHGLLLPWVLSLDIVYKIRVVEPLPILLYNLHSLIHILLSLVLLMHPLLPRSVIVDQSTFHIIIIIL